MTLVLKKIKRLVQKKGIYEKSIWKNVSLRKGVLLKIGFLEQKKDPKIHMKKKVLQKGTLQKRDLRKWPKKKIIRKINRNYSYNKK